MIQALDENHDGKISADEFRAPEIAKFNKVDANHDGIVTPDEARLPPARNRRAASAGLRTTLPGGALVSHQSTTLMGPEALERRASEP